MVLMHYDTLRTCADAVCDICDRPEALVRCMQHAFISGRALVLPKARTHGSN